MTGYLSMKMKRKDLEQVYDEFSDFSLSSPARKIRRLDAELPPIMEEDETPEINLGLDQSPSTAGDQGQCRASVTESQLSDIFSERKALVLYKPINTPLMEITVNSDLVPCWRNIDNVFWSGKSNQRWRQEDDPNDTRKSPGVKDDSLAVIPWVPSHSELHRNNYATTDTPIMEVSEQMVEGEGVEDSAMMEIEDENFQVTGDQQQHFCSETWQQWQQQHCMTPQLPQNNSTPILWS